MKTIFLQWHKNFFDWSESEYSIKMWNKNHLTSVSQSTWLGQLTSYEQPLKGCVCYLNRCTTSPTYILYQLNEKKWAYTYHICFYHKHCHFWKRHLSPIHVISTCHTAFMKFRTEKTRQASFQIVWRIGKPKRIPLLKWTQ